MPPRPRARGTAKDDAIAVSSSPPPSPKASLVTSPSPATGSARTQSLNSLGKRPLKAKSKSEAIAQLPSSSRPVKRPSVAIRGDSSSGDDGFVMTTEPPTASAPATANAIASSSRAPQADSSDEDDFFDRRKAAHKRKVLASRQQRQSSQQQSAGGSSLDRRSDSLRRTDSTSTELDNGPVASLAVDEDPLPRLSQTSPPPTSSPRSSETDSDDSMTGNGGRRRKKKTHTRLPSWTRASGPIMEDDEDGSRRSASQEVAEASSPSQERANGVASQTGPRRRRRSSVSLTPPPALRREEQEYIDNLVKQALPVYQQPDSDPESPEAHRPSVSARPRVDSAIGRTSSASRAHRSGIDEPPTASPSLHPDLAVFYRGPQAATIRAAAAEERKKRELEEEERRKKEREEARAKAQQLAQKRSEDAVVIESADGETGGPTAKTSSAVGNAKSHPLAQEAISLLDSDEEDGPSTISTAQVNGVQQTTTVNDSTATSAHGASSREEPEAQEASGEHLELTLRGKDGTAMTLSVRKTTTFRKMWQHFIRCCEVARKVQEAFDAEQAKSAADDSPPSATSARGGRGGKRGRGGKAVAARAPTVGGVRLLFDGEVLDLDKTVEDVEELEDGELVDVTW